MSNIRIGISGWTYAPWRGVFYPKGLKQKQELGYASQKVSAIEVNGTFYSLQKPAVFTQWYKETPEDFQFTIKAPKYITHVRRLQEVEEPLANFMASGLLALKEKLGAILWQFPPFLPFIPERFENFLALLPHTAQEASKLAKGHQDWLKGRALTTVRGDWPMRHAIEVRHHSFKCKEFIEMLQRHRVAIVVGDNAGRWPYMEDVTADFVYVRLHGDETLYPKGYPAKALKRWADRLRCWSDGAQPDDAVCVIDPPSGQRPQPKVIYAFFDNDTKVTAPRNALDLMQCLTKRIKIKATTKTRKNAA